MGYIKSYLTRMLGLELRLWSQRNLDFFNMFDLCRDAIPAEE